ncbi:4Fe-4S binding protein [Anaerotignum sp.]|uniref:4Fe-4S binding protein n=1 Tax=Anaerotignum sp. TaxID=2039241 RepID=UPI003333072D
MKKIATVSTKDCVSCGCCEKVCPKNAIAIYHGIYAKVNESLCIGCGICAKACPADIISIKEVDSLG